MVDPLRDESLPAGTAALVVGGGFPEVHARALSDNERLRKDVADFAATGGVVVGECAGLLYLAKTLDNVPMCGVLNLTAMMTPRLTLGYREAVAASDSVITRRGEAMRAHEFHRTACLPSAGPAPAWAFGGAGEGFASSSVHASYLHLHWAGYPVIARRIVKAAREVTLRQGNR